MKISFTTHSAFLRDEKQGFVYSIRLSLLGEGGSLAGSLTQATWDGFNAINNDITQVVENFSHTAGQKIRQVSHKTALWFEVVRSKPVQWLLNLIIAATLMAGVAWLAPKAFYSIFPVPVVPTQTQESGSPLGGDFELGARAGDVVPEKEEPEKTPYLPEKNENLPEGNWLIIPRIGVRSELQATENYEDALATGLWQVPDFAAPGEYDLPMIVAGHRYGWKWWWKSDYWRYHSFYLLPDLEPGDIVEVVSDQRKWTYEIYAGEEGSEISDYDADLILYTCKYLSGPARFFRYARLIDLEKDSQGW